MTGARVTTMTLPIHHARDWLARYEGPGDGSAYDAEAVRSTARTITLQLGDAALADMISDALYYSEEMDRENTGDRDYRPPARTLLRTLERLGFTWSRRGFTITDLEPPAELVRN